MGKVTVTSITVYSSLPWTDEEEGIAYEAAGDVKKPELVDEWIRDSGRCSLKAHEGKISITIGSGDEQLGDLSINVQFEGPHGAHDLCLKNQGELFEAASGWLGELLAAFDADFEVKIQAKPCPHTEKRLPLRQSAAKIEVKNKGGRWISSTETEGDRGPVVKNQERHDVRS